MLFTDRGMEKILKSNDVIPTTIIYWDEFNDSRMMPFNIEKYLKL